MAFKIKHDLKKTDVYKTGAHRSASTGKGRYDLIPTRAVRRVAKHYEDGGAIYGFRNWEKGMPFSRLVDSAKRHIDQFIEGETTEDHLAAAVWNIFGIMHFQEVEEQI